VSRSGALVQGETIMKNNICKLAAVGLLFWSFGAQAATSSYSTTLSLESPSVDGITTVVFDWSTSRASGIMSVNDLVDYSVSLYVGPSLIYSNDVLINGVAQPLESVPRDFPFWDYDLDTLTLRQFTLGTLNILQSGSVSGTHYEITDGISLPEDGKVYIYKFVGGHDADFDIATISNQGTTVEHPTADCSGPPVKMGEVMAGFQAGFTGGSHTEVGNPADFFMTLSGEDRRGFIIPETPESSAQCENDFILVSGFIAAAIERPDGTVVRQPKEAKDLVSSGFSGFFAEQRFEVDGVLIEHMNSAAKIGYVPSGFRVSVMTSGIILAPNSLEPGLHSASVIYGIDEDQDGNVDYEWPFTKTFTIAAGPAE
jgi:hypothetical protein